MAIPASIKQYLDAEGVDYQLRNRKLGLDQTQIDFGAGYMF